MLSTSMAHEHLHIVRMGGDKKGPIIGLDFQGTASQIARLVDYGVHRPQSLTGQLIYEVGRSRLKILKNHRKGIRTAHESEKLNTISLTQRLLRSVQELERELLNPLANHEAILKAFEGKVEGIYQKIGKVYDPASLLFQDHLLPTQDYLKQIAAEARQHLSADADHTVLHLKAFLSKATRAMIHQGQDLNAAFVFDYQFTSINRGELNDHFEEALKVVNDFPMQEWSQPVLCEHQGRIRTDPQADKKKRYHFSSEAHGVQDLAAMAVAVENILKPKEQRSHHEHAHLPVVNSKGWSHLGASVKRKLQGLGWGVMGALVDTGGLFYRFSQRIAGKKPDWSQSVAHSFFEKAQQPAGHSLHAESNAGLSPHRPWYWKAFVGMRFLTHKVLVRPAQEIFDATKQGLRSTEISFRQKVLRETVETIHAKIKAKAEAVAIDIPPFTAPVAVPPHAVVDSFKVPYPLIPEKPKTIFGAGSSWLRVYSEVFSDLYAKSPIKGLAYSALMVVSLAAILVPHILTATKAGVKFVQMMAAMEKSSAGYGTFFNKDIAALAASTNIAQLGVLLGSAVFEGRESKFAQSVGAMAESWSINPALAVSAGLGQSGMAQEVSDFLKMNAAKNPQLAELSIGLETTLSLENAKNTRGVMGETLYRIGKALIKPVAIVGELAAGLYQAAKYPGQGILKRTASHAAWEVLKWIAKDIGKDIILDIVQSAAHLAVTGLRLTAKILKSTIVVLTIAIPLKTIKLFSMAKNLFFKKKEREGSHQHESSKIIKAKAAVARHTDDFMQNRETDMLKAKAIVQRKLSPMSHVADAWENKHAHTATTFMREMAHGPVVSDLNPLHTHPNA